MEDIFCSVMLAESDGLGDYIFGLDPQLIFGSVVTIVAMLFLFIFLSYILFNPARNMLEKRKEAIRQQMEEAAKDREEADSYKQEYDAKLKEVNTEAEQILEDSRKKALKKENDIINRAKEEANTIRERADKEIELEKSKLKDDVKNEIVSVASAMAEKIVSTSLDEKGQKKLLEDTLEEMGEETWLS